MTDVQVEEKDLQTILAETEDLGDKLQIITSQLGVDYTNWKESEEAKDTTKNSFFDLLTTYIQENVPLERRTERVLLKVDEDIDTALVTRYPDMRVVIDNDGDPLMEENPEDAQEWIVVLEPRPEMMKFEYVNREDGMVYTRGRTERGASFDVLGFISEFPDLAEQCVIQEVALVAPATMDLAEKSADDLLEMADVRFTLNEEKAEALVVADPSLLPVFMKFRIAPKISMSLQKPRKAKADELS